MFGPMVCAADLSRIRNPGKMEFPRFFSNRKSCFSAVSARFLATGGRFSDSPRLSVPIDVVNFSNGRDFGAVLTHYRF